LIERFFRRKIPRFEIEKPEEREFKNLSPGFFFILNTAVNLLTEEGAVDEAQKSGKSTS
jgi:hypothetical protein